MKVYILSWYTESSDRGIDGYWEKPLTMAQQHGYFKENYSCDYNTDGDRYIYWDMIELELEKIPHSLLKKKWTEGC